MSPTTTKRVRLTAEARRGQIVESATDPGAATVSTDWLCRTRLLILFWLWCPGGDFPLR